MILIIGAMQEEVNALVQRMDTVKHVEVQSIAVVEGYLSGKLVSVALSGIGKVNAAFVTTLLIARLKPDFVINIGSAGGLLDGQKIGDVVVARTLQYHDLDIGPTTHKDPRFIFSCSENLVDKAIATLKHHDISYHDGLIVTGDQFITKHQPQFKTIQTRFPNAICVEMEAASIGAVCARMQTPFIVLRSLSDITYEDENQVSFEDYLHVASENSARICEYFIA